MNLIGNRVLVQPDEIKMWRGLHIPEDITDYHNPFMDERIGTVIAIGNGRLTKKGIRVPVQVNVGDRVLLPRAGMVRVDVDDKRYWMLDSDLILGVLE